MKQVAVIHNKFTTTGGAETVCLNTLEALQGNYELSLFTFDEPNFDSLNDFCGTDVDPVPVHRPKFGGSVFNKIVSKMNDITDGQFGPHIQLKTAILNRLIRTQTEKFDLQISTGNELYLDQPSIQYIHFPMFNRRRLNGDVESSGFANYGYNDLCSRIAGVTEATLSGTTVLTNSEWTAARIKQIYETEAEVVFPPVNVDEFHHKPWEERSPGFVAIGRISPDKNQLKLIEIIERVRDRGHGVTLHLVGPSASHNKHYHEQVMTAASEREYVTYEGKLNREALVDTVCSNRYGIHGKPDEHFGITVAELIAGGTVPFVPDSGGQVELVNRQPELLYNDVDDAVKSIDAVLSDPDSQHRLRKGLQDVSDLLGQERFQSELLRIVRNTLSG